MKFGVLARIHCQFEEVIYIYIAILAARLYCLDFTGTYFILTVFFFFFFLYEPDKRFGS